MKLIIALFFSGVAFAVASPTCSDDALNQCFANYPKPDDAGFTESEEYLNQMCTSWGCMVDYKRRCGTEGVHPASQLLLKQTEKIYSAVCGTVRLQYLQNAKCLNRVVKSLVNKCKVKEGIEKGDPDYCQHVIKYLQCSLWEVRSECGKDALDVYIAVAPGMDFYECNK